MFDRVRKFWWKRQRLASARRVLRESGQVHPIFILGLSRSGSTWLQEMIGAWPGTLNLFEPIHRRIRGTLGASTLEDIAPTSTLSLDERRVLEGILDGRLLTPKTLQPGKIPQQIGRVCIKLINCNNGVERMTRELALRYAPLVILRHPCAHVASWKRLNWTEKFGGFETRVPHLLAAQPLFAKVVTQLASPVERMAASWCLGNFLPLVHEPQGRWRVVRYESLQADPFGELQAIFQAWSEPGVPPEVTAQVTRPSRTTWRDGDMKTFRPDTWVDELTPEEESTVYRTCERFGIAASRHTYLVLPGAGVTSGSAGGSSGRS